MKHFLSFFRIWPCFYGKKIRILYLYAWCIFLSILSISSSLVLRYSFSKHRYVVTVRQRGRLRPPISKRAFTRRPIGRWFFTRTFSFLETGPTASGPPRNRTDSSLPIFSLTGRCSAPVTQVTNQPTTWRDGCQGFRRLLPHDHDGSGWSSRFLPLRPDLGTTNRRQLVKIRERARATFSSVVRDFQHGFTSPTSPSHSPQPPPPTSSPCSCGTHRPIWTVNAARNVYQSPGVPDLIKCLIVSFTTPRPTKDVARTSRHQRPKRQEDRPTLLSRF